MKIQCNCGAKFAFDVTPEMIAGPVKFVCPACGLDASEYVTQLVHQQQAPVPTPAPVARATSAVPVARVAPADQPEAEAAALGTPCAKHARETAVEKCRVCGKPICAQCMEMFGYVCSPLCRARASSSGVRIPVFAGQKSVREARRWRVIGWSTGTAAALVALFLGVWFWYAWFGCAPKAVFSVRFPERSYSGQSAFAGKESDQLVFLHGDTLARYELKSGKQVWSRQLLDRKQIAATVEQELKDMAAAKLRAEDQGGTFGRIPSADKMQKDMEKSMAAAMNLYVRGEDVWVGTPEKLVRYDWATGRPAREIPVPPGEEIKVNGEELLVMNHETEVPAVTHINMATGEARSTEIAGASPQARSGSRAGLAATTGPAATAGLPIGPPGQGAGRPMDPAKVAQQAQQLPFQAKVALPALVAASMNQERLTAELNDNPDRKPRAAAANNDADAEAFVPPMMVRTPEGYVELRVDAKTNS